ncbi:MAG: hypothetical protein DIU70_009445 [Bacillota bacterium]|nr:MAG: hypothetical protein DIU70_04520 [Bacillota bacterium]
MRRRLWLLAGILLTLAGCMGSGGAQQPQGQGPPSVDREHVKQAVTAALHEEDMKDFLRRELRDVTATVLLEQALRTDDGRSALSEAVRRHLESAIGKEQLEEAVLLLTEKPEVQQALREAIRETLLEVLARGVGGGEQGGQRSGGGGGNGGGGGSGSGGGGGGS